ncbi:MAG: T9SS type A sorting domain-containing protein [Bacteroidetes bacterium]|nr:T9SS type A sorting domain-containing protein [Bacteroidota bacterium]
MALPVAAQVPLTVDTSFRFYYPYQLMAHWDSTAGPLWGASVNDLVLRLDGNVMAVGSDLLSMDEAPHGIGHAVVLSTTGDPLLFPSPLTGGPIAELHTTNQYFGINSASRYNYDGSIDWSYGPDTSSLLSAGGARFPDHGTLVFEDRSSLMSGYFPYFGDTAVLVKKDEWGHLDTTSGFPIHYASGGANISGMRIFQLSNGQFLFTGQNWTHYDGRPAGAVLRLHADGSLDTTFRFPSARSFIPTIHEQEDGKLIMAGIIWMDGNPDTLDMVRVNVDGSLDSTFNNQIDFRTGPSPYNDLIGEVTVLKPLDAGRYLVGGWFTAVNGEPRSSIACIDTAGNLLGCWAGGGLHPCGYIGSPQTALLYGYECIEGRGCYIYGHYAGISDANGFHPEQVLMSRLNMPDVGVAEVSKPAPLSIWPNPGQGTVYLQWPGNIVVHAEVHDVMGRTVAGPVLLNAPFILNLSNLPPGLYHVLLTAPNGHQTAAKWVRE